MTTTRDCYRAFSELISGPVEELYAEIESAAGLSDDDKAELVVFVDNAATELYQAKTLVHKLLTRD